MSKVSAFVVCGLLFGGTPASAQAPTGGIVGVVTDLTGAVVVNAAVSVVNAETSLTRALTTSPAGAYSGFALPPGRYTVTVEASGFRRVERAATVEAGTVVTI